MFNIMIVEDDHLLRESLAGAMDWETLGFRVAAVAEDGADALDQLKQTRIDVVLTDIRMPEIDGLQLLREIKLNDNRIEVVLLSGYREFQYAEQGLNLGAYGYVLKTEVVDNLKIILTRLYAKLSSQRVQKQEMERLHELTNAVRLKDFLGNAGIPGEKHGRQYRVAVLCFAAVGLSGREQLIGLAGNLGLLFVSEPYYLVMVQSMDPGMLEEMNRRIVQLTDHCANNGISFTMGIGLCYSSRRKLLESYHEAMKMVDRARHSGGQPVLHYMDHARTESATATPVALPIYRERLLSSIQQQKYTAMPMIFAEGLGQWMGDPEIRMEQIQELFIQVLIRLWTDLPDQRKDESPADKLKEVINRINHTDSLFDLQSWLMPVVDHWIEAADRHHREQYFTDISKAVEYIDRHFSNDLSLNELAAKLYLSPSQFSKKFKMETGFNFIEYMKNKRMQLAGELLRSTKMKIDDIGEQVGYRDVKHFHKVFKTIHGKSPYQYRKTGE